MALKEEEKQRWLEARRLGIDYEDARDDEYFDEAVSAHGDDNDDSDDADLEAGERYTHCVHCGNSIDGGALCAACE